MKKEEMQGEVFINSEEKISKKKVIYFFEQKTPVHIKLKNGKWLNGDIILIELDLFMIEDFKRGEVPVLFEELEHIEKYKLKEENGNQN